MSRPFFPNPEFAWGFSLLLFGILAVAAYVDQKRMVIPKWITLNMLAAGVIANIVRAAWVSTNGFRVFFFEGGSAWLGGLDGLLFALLGAAAGFAVMFVLWILGTCGGGDVKLFAALGAWLGPLYPLYVLLVSLGVLLVLVLYNVVTGGVSVASLAKVRQRQQRKLYGNGKETQPGKPPRMRLSYSLPVAIAAVVVVVWAFREELKLKTLFPDNPKVVSHAR